ncbi:MAG: SRPBCC family protein [Mycobacterium sp.]|nr:SRPBCC family protein [Mycobacterium sp.]
MPRIAVVKGVDAPAGTVWELLSDFADISWIPVIEDVEIDGEGLGMTRKIDGSGHQPILETLTHRDDERMKLGYSIAHSPLPGDALRGARHRPAGDRHRRGHHVGSRLRPARQR